MPTSGFTKKCLLPSIPISQKLLCLRTEKKVSLETLAHKTRINKKYLKALEEGRFADIHCSPVYIKNFVKKFAEGLGELAKPYVDQFEREELIAEVDTPITTPKSRVVMHNVPRIIRLALSGVGVALFMLYLGLHIHNILQPPTLLIVSPTDGDIMRENVVTIKGKTDPETKVSVNDKQIGNDEKGNFEEHIALSPGINTLIVSAQNKHGKVSTETYHVIYKDIGAISQR